jgi:hydroxymethylbilane synthase
VVALGTVGVFVKRIEEALLADEIDLAVHSLKDMPTEQPEGLTIAAVPERHDARDALISVEGWKLDQVPSGTRVGTGSPRRRCQLLHFRPDLKVVPIRGNVDTRLTKLEKGEVGAVVLAVAGLERLGLDRLPMQPIAIDVCLPAVGQGALAVEIRADDPRSADLVASLNHAPSMARVEAERAFLRRLGGGCLAPATAYARITNDRLHVEAIVGDPDGRALLLERESGEVSDATEIGERLAKRLLVAGASRILSEARAIGSGDA